MTPTIILCIIIAQFVIGGIGLIVWKRGGHREESREQVARSKGAEADSDRCQVLLGNIGQLLNTHGQLLRFLDRGDGENRESAKSDPFASALAQRKINFGRLLEDRVDELSDVLEKYDDLYLHERLQLKDYANRAEKLESMLSELESQAGESAAVLVQLVRGMLQENRQLRTTVEGCRTRITELVAIAMRSGRDARVDALTQLPNRRAWIERLSVLNDTERLAIAIMDIDNFKVVNDQFGHAAGDAILRLVSRILREESRALPFRNGGDEFYVLVDSRSMEEARACVETIRARIERASVLFDGKRLLATVSGGVAFPHGRELLEATIARADKALYEAKMEKNCVVGCTAANSETNAVPV